MKTSTNDNYPKILESKPYEVYLWGYTQIHHYITIIGQFSFYLKLGPLSKIEKLIFFSRFYTFF